MQHAFAKILNKCACSMHLLKY